MSPALSHDGLHALLWNERVDGTVRIQQNLWCERLLVSRYTLNRVLKAMEVEGRIRSLTASLGATVKTYEVADPGEWFG